MSLPVFKFELLSPLTYCLIYFVFPVIISPLPCDGRVHTLNFKSSTAIFILPYALQHQLPIDLNWVQTTYILIAFLKLNWILQLNSEGHKHKAIYHSLFSESLFWILSDVYKILNLQLPVQSKLFEIKDKNYIMTKAKVAVSSLRFCYQFPN